MNKLFRQHLCHLMCATALFFTGMTPAVAETDIKSSANPASTHAVELAATASLKLTGEEKAWLAEHKTIRVAFDGYFPPYSFLNEDTQFEGLAVDTLQILAHRIGVTLEISPKVIWKDLYETAKRREVDVVATMGRQPAREEWFAFTRPYIFKSLVIMTKEETTDINKPEDLAGKKITLVESYQYVKPLLEQYPSIKPYYVNTMLDGLNGVATGRADAAITFVGAGYYLKTKYHIANLKFVAVFERDRFTESIAVRKDWSELATIFDKALASITDQEMTELNRRWIGPEEIIGIRPHTFFIYLGSVFGLGLLLIAGFTIWNRALQRQVNQRTAELRQELAERKKTEEALQESEERFRHYFEQANIGFALTSPEKGWLRVNHRLCDMFGYPEEELFTKTWAEMTHPEDLESDERQFNRVLAGEIDNYELDKRFYRKDGRLVPTHLTVSCVRKPDSSVSFIIATLEDISSRKQAEAEIERINEELRAVNRIIMICASTLDAQKILDKIMDEALLITGLEGGTICSVTPEQTLEIIAHRQTSQATITDLTTHTIKVGDCLCGECARDHKPLILHDRAAVLKFSTREATRGEDIRFHAAFPLVSGKRCIGVLCIFTRTDAKPTEQSLKLLETVSSQIAMAIDNAKLYAESIHQAVTLEEQVRERTSELDEARRALLNLVEDLNSSNAKLKELDQLKSMFIASMSHELRTPLNSVIGFSSILLNKWQGPLNEEQEKNLAIILRAGKHLLALINDVIDISKIEAGALPIELETFELDELLAEAVESVLPDAEDKGLTVELQSCAADMHTDRRRLLQCVLNLLSNAVKFSHQGVIIVTAQCNGDAVITVTDPGIGIRSADLPTLFQAFVRLSPPGQATYPGTGLGLYLTRKLTTEVLDGTVGATSEEGRGSSFTITIPKQITDQKGA